MGAKLAHFTRRAGITAALAAICSGVMASGFRIPEVSTLGTGTSNALVANTKEVGALAYNPAAMSFHDGTAVNAGITRITYEPEVTPDVGTPSGSTGEDVFLIPNLYMMTEGYNDKSFGLAINVPFGLETKWPIGTFGGFGGGAAQGFAPELSRIKMFNINPNMAWKIDETSSFAVGIDLYDLDELVFNTNGATIKGNGSDLGWNIGYQKKLGKASFGISYRSNVEVDVSGVLHAFASGAPPIAASATLEFPDMLQAGIYYQMTDALAVELDVERTGWSSFGKISIKDSTGTEQVSSTNNWDDTWAYRLGAIYQLNPKTKLLFGYSMDETPQPDEYFSARVPDDDRQLFSVGITHDYNDWTLEAAYMHVDVDDRDVNSSTTYTAGVTPDPNGTEAYNGTYETDSTLLSIGASMKF